MAAARLGLMTATVVEGCALARSGENKKQQSMTVKKNGVIAAGASGEIRCGFFSAPHMGEIRKRCAFEKREKPELFAVEIKWDFIKTNLKDE